MPEQGRWAGRNPGKDLVRNDVWTALERAGVAVGPAWSMIPNFVGADQAALHLAQAKEWAGARTIKTNPDHAQAPIRIRALYEGKTVYPPSLISPRSSLICGWTRCGSSRAAFPSSLPQLRRASWSTGKGSNSRTSSRWIFASSVPSR